MSEREREKGGVEIEGKRERREGRDREREREPKELPVLGFIIFTSVKFLPPSHSPPPL